MERKAFYIGEGAHAFFAWRHEDASAPPVGLCAVILPPVGYEFTRAHRTLRHLADRLAARGIPAIRVDFHGVGDSPGDELEDERVATWIRNARDAIAYARQGGREVCVIGVRFGATLAALASREEEVASLVLWNPCVSGRTYVRELQALAAGLEGNSGPSVEGAIESVGFVMSPAMVASLRAIDLARTPPRAPRILVVARDDAAPPNAFFEATRAAGSATEMVRAPGWEGMMAEHLYSVVPDVAIDGIVGWAAQSAVGGGRRAEDGPPASLPPSISFDSIIEEPCFFGFDSHLFGIVTRPERPADLPAIVIFNAGCVHHVGPNRLSVMLARSLAAAGYPCLRFDLEGIGDSVMRGPGRENDPYPPSALDDARASFAFLTERYGYKEFVALGLCSGAHTSFHAGLNFQEECIGELILINPLTFYWEEGFDQATHFEDAVAYRKSLRDPSRWKKLLRGDVDIARLTQVLVSQVLVRVKARAEALREMVMPGSASRLSRDLRKLSTMRRRMTLFVAESDPGREILMTSARRATARGLKSGEIRFEVIPEADHTFTLMKTRRELVARLHAHLSRQGTFTQGM